MRPRLPLRALLLRLLAALLVVLVVALAGLWLLRPTVPPRLSDRPAVPPAARIPVARPAEPVLPAAPPPANRGPTPPAAVAKVAEAVIIMDDLGRELRPARELLAIELAVTFSVLPNEPHAREVAELARQGGREVMIHLPMEPNNYPRANPGSDALMVALPAEELHRLMRAYRERVPYAVGANNHMGSRFTAERQGLAVVLEELRQAGFFFVDSRTTAASVGLALAQELGVPAFGRDIFLDNQATLAAVTAEVERLIDMARQHGRAVAICHPYPATLQALRRLQGRFAARGVEVVQASRFLAPPLN